MTQSKELLASILDETDIPAFCPQCHEALNRYELKPRKVWMRLHVRAKGKNGELLLAPGWDVVDGRVAVQFERRTDLELEEGQVVDDLLCPHCGGSLIEKDAHCEECASPVAVVVASMQSKLVDFSICSKVGCGGHGISPTDEARIKPKVGRQKKPEQDAMLRTRNFQEVSYGFDRELAVTEAAAASSARSRRAWPAVRWASTSPASSRLVKDGQVRRGRAPHQGRRTPCPRSAAASVPRTTSARRSACWARRSSRWRSATSSASRPTSSVRPTR